MSKQTDLINIPDAITVSGSNVGIGTSSPEFALDVVDGTSYQTVQLNTSTGSNAAQRVGIHSRNYAGSSSIGIISLADTAGTSASLFVGGAGGATSPQTITFETTSTYGTGGSERMRINSSGQVGIGTSSPTINLDVAGGAGGIRYTASGGASTLMYSNTSAGYLGTENNYPVVIQQNNAERMRIDSSGNLLVGNTDTSPYDRTSGNAIAIGDGLISSAQSGGNAAIFNRMTNDGSIVGFRKNGTSVGSIGCYADKFYIGDGDTGICFVGEDDVILPCSPSSNNNRDDAITLGAAAVRFKDAYLSGGIYLGGTGSGNKLDDFEEGLYTVSAQTGSGSITLDSTNNKYSYVKVGKLVTVTGRIDVSSVSSPSGPLALTLPFAVSTGVKYESAISLFIWNATSSAPETGLWIGWVTNGSNTISLRYGNSNTPSANVANYIQAGTEFRISASYQTDA